MDFFLLIVFGYPSCLVVHECGHFLCARLVGYSIMQISFGRGPVALRRRIVETEFLVRAIPLGGRVVCYPPLFFQKWRETIYFLGGVIANGVVSLALLLLVNADQVPVDWAAAAFALGWMHSATALLNLAPGTARGAALDGLHLLRLVKTRSKPGLTAIGTFYVQLLASREPGRPFTPRDTRTASRMAHWLALASAGGDAATRDIARRALARELARNPKLSAPEAAVALDRLLTDAVLRAQQATPAQLDVWSSRLLRLYPHQATAWGSRGAALVLLGRTDEGVTLLRQCHEAADASGFDRLVSALLLAQAELAAGDRDLARRWLAAAQGETQARRTLDSNPSFAAEFARVEMLVLTNNSPSSRSRP